MMHDTPYPARVILALFLFLASPATHPVGGVATDAVGTESGLGADAVLLALYVALAILFSFLCSIAEAVLLSITPSYIGTLQEKQPKRAAQLRKLKEENIDKSLAAILTVNTIAHTVGAIGAGAKATVVFGSTWFGVFSAVMTLLILFFSEIVPKTLGAVYWRDLTGPTAAYINFLIIVMYPLIWISELVTKVIARGGKGSTFHRDELIAMADIGKQTGQIDERESRIIRNLLRLKSLRASDIMTPRVVVSAFAETLSVSQALGTPNATRFSRIPVYAENIDRVNGFVLRDDLLQAQASGQGGKTVISFRRELLAIPPAAGLPTLLDAFLDRRQHIALVVGEYGDTEGIVTLEDVMETLLGMEIVDERDSVVDMQAMARKLWQQRAEARGMKVLPAAEGDEGTVAGALGRPHG